MSNTDVLVHRPLPLLQRESVPRPLLDHRIHEQVFATGRLDPRTTALLLGVDVAVDVLRAPGHRQIGVDGVEMRAHRRTQHGCLELLKILEALAHHPQDKVGVGTRAQGAESSQDCQLLGERLEYRQQLGSRFRPLIG